MTDLDAPPTDRRRPTRRPTLRTLALATLISCSVALVVVLIVILIRPQHPPAAPTPQDDKIDASGALPTPEDVTVRALTTSTPPKPPSRPSSSTQTVLTANLYLAEPGKPLPQPARAPSKDLVPTGQAAIRCTEVSQNAITALCDGQALTGRGQLTFAGAMIESDALADPPDADLQFAITGGTGDYQAARGTLEITAYSPTQQDWTFHFASPATPTND